MVLRVQVKFAQSAEVGLAVSGAQPLFTLGLLMFALSLVDFLSLLLSPSTYFKIFIFVKSIIWWHIQNLQKISCWFKTWMGFVGPKVIKLWTSFIWGFLSCLCDGHLGIAYANMLATTKWPLECAAHLTLLVWVCVLWLPEYLMDLSALCLDDDFL